MNIHIRHSHAKGAVADQAALEQFQQQGDLSEAGRY
jgi:hypothetical protein